MTLNHFVKLVRLPLTIILFSVAPSATIAHPSVDSYDHYVYGGDSCQTRNPNVKKIRRIDGALKNINEENSYTVTCPIIVMVQRPDNLPGDNANEHVDIFVIVTFANSHSKSQIFNCKFTASRFFGTEIIDGQQSVKIPAGETDSVKFTIRGVSSNAFLGTPPRMECSLRALSQLLHVNILVDEEV